MVLDCDDNDELIGDPTSNFLGGVADNLELSISITLPVAEEDALLRFVVLPLLKVMIAKQKNDSNFLN